MTIEMLTKNFSSLEMQCSHTGKCDMQPEFMELLQSIRNEYGKAMYISSGYRDVTHPVEAMKEKTQFSAPGVHTLGLAADIIAYGIDAVALTRIALGLGITRLGFFQRGRASGRFIHIDIADKHTADFPAALWTY